MSRIYRLPVQLIDKKKVVSDLQTEKYWDPVEKKTFRGRPLQLKRVDVESYGLKPVLIEIDSEEKRAKFLDNVEELVECIYAKTDLEQQVKKIDEKPDLKLDIKSEETDPENIKLGKINLDDLEFPISDGLEKLDQIYSIL